MQRLPSCVFIVIYILGNLNYSEEWLWGSGSCCGGCGGGHEEHVDDPRVKSYHHGHQSTYVIEDKPKHRRWYRPWTWVRLRKNRKPIVINSCGDGWCSHDDHHEDDGHHHGKKKKKSPKKKKRHRHCHRCHGRHRHHRHHRGSRKCHHGHHRHHRSRHHKHEDEHHDDDDDNFEEERRRMNKQDVFDWLDKSMEKDRKKDKKKKKTKDEDKKKKSDSKEKKDDDHEDPWYNDRS